MYVFLEHHRDAETGKVVTTDVVASSHRNGVGIYWKTDRDLLEFLAKLFKTPAIKDRMYDDATKVWTYLGDEGWKLLQVIQKTLKDWPMFRVEFVEIENLLEQIKAGGIRPTTRQSAYDPATFFYQKEQKFRSPTLTKDYAAEKIAGIFQIPLEDFKALDKDSAKSAYRRAAIRLHPDRNNGDGTLMSELNMLWGVYNA